MWIYGTIAGNLAGPSYISELFRGIMLNPPPPQKKTKQKTKQKKNNIA